MTYQSSADGFGTLADGSTLVIQRWLPGPLERVWRYLTVEEDRRKWLAAGEMTLIAGAPLELVWRNDDLSGGPSERPEGFAEVQTMASRVVAVEPMTSLTIAWGEGDVTFDLREKDGKVLLTVTHRGLADRAGRTMVAAGWHMHVDILAAVATGEAPPSFWSGWERLREAYGQRLPA